MASVDELNEFSSAVNILLSVYPLGSFAGFTNSHINGFQGQEEASPGHYFRLIYRLTVLIPPKNILTGQSPR